MSKRALHSEGPLLHFLRNRRGWSLDRLGQAFDMTGPAVHHFESGRRPLSPERLAVFAEAMSYTEPEIRLHRRTVEALTFLQAEGRPEAEGAARPLDREEIRVRAVSAEHGVVNADQFGRELGGLFAEISARALRREAGRAFRAWIVAPRAEQRLLVDSHREYQTQGMVEQIGLASIRSAAKDPRLPLHFANLALRAAERLEAPPEVRSAVQGWAWAFVGNAQRVWPNLREADEAFGRAHRLWKAGAEAKGVLVEHWRLPDLEASLRRDQRRWKECLVLSDQALCEAPDSARGRILIERAAALEPMGEPKKALQALAEAEPWVQASGDRDLALALRFNQAVNLTHLGQLEAARQRSEEARKLAVELGRDLYLVHCVWISGRIAGEAGEQADATTLLQQARRDFTARQMPLEAAYIALDEAVYLLQMGAADQVTTLATEVAWVFAMEGVREEALKALRLFYEGARTHQLTVAFAREARESFRKAV